MSTLLVGCKTSNDVVSDGWIQKRKYRPGFHIGLKKETKHELNYISTKEVLARTPSFSHREVGSMNTRPLMSSLKKEESEMSSRAEMKERRLMTRQMSASIRKPSPFIHRVEEKEPPSEEEIRRAKLLSFIRIGILTAIILILGPISLLIISELLLITIPYFLIPIAWFISLALPAMIALLVIYIIEHFKVLKGKSLFTKERRENWRGSAVVALLMAGSILLVAIFLAGLILGVYTIILLLTLVGVLGSTAGLFSIGSGIVFLILGLVPAIAAALAFEWAIVAAVLGFSRSFKPRRRSE